MSYSSIIRRVVSGLLASTLIMGYMLSGVSSAPEVYFSYTRDPIASNGGYMQLIAGDSQTCGLRDDNTLWCWGNLPDGYASTPKQIVFPVDTLIQYVTDSGTGYMGAMMADGSVYSWGWYDATSDTRVTTPTRITGLSPGTAVTNISMTQYVMYILLNDGSLYSYDSTTLELSLVTGFPTGTKVNKIYTSPLSVFVVLDTNEVYGWGSNRCGGSYGCLGVGDTTNGIISTPAPVLSLPKNPIKKIIISRQEWNGRQYALALYNDGSVYAWGDNQVGELGVGDQAIRYTPEVVLSLSGVQDIYATDMHSIFAVMSDGSVYGWGANISSSSCSDPYNLLGTASLNSYEATPAQLPGIQIPSGVAVKNIASTRWSDGCNFSVLLMNSGDIYGWGSIRGIGADHVANTPELLTYPTSMTPVIDILVTRGNIYYLQDNGLVYSVGYGASMGVGATRMSVTPIQTPLSGAVSSVAANGYNAFAVMQDGSMYGWGANFGGMLGVEDNSSKYIGQPVLMNFSGSISSIVTNTNGFTFAVMQDGSVYGWGNNMNGQLGVGDITSQYIAQPTLVNLTGSVSSVVTSGNSTFAVMQDGSVYGWGNNMNGQLGVGDITSQYIAQPTLVNLTGSVSSVVTSGNSTFAVMQDGSVYGWGYNGNQWSGYGLLGVGNTSSGVIFQPTLVNLTGSVSSVIASVDGSIFSVMQDGSVYGWGYNMNGILGVGDTNPRYTPTLVNLTGSVSSVIASVDGSIFSVMQDGSVYGWGYNGNQWSGYGLLGVGNTSSGVIFQPTLVNLTGSVSSVVTNTNGSTFAVMQDGSMYGWGYNMNGQLGVGDITSQYIAQPTLVNLIGSVSSVVTNTNGSTFAVMQDGSVYGWGVNWYGQLGYPGTDAYYYSPTPVIGPYGAGQLDLSVAVVHPINALDDSYVGRNISTGSIDILGNDAYSGGVATVSDVNISLVGWVSGPISSGSSLPSLVSIPDGIRIVGGGLSGSYLNTTTGDFVVSQASAIGDYTVSYKICDKNYNPRNCSVASIVVSIRLPEVVARTDSGSILSTESGSINLLANDTYSGALAHSGNVSITLIANTVSGATLSPSGILSVPPGVSVGKYSFIYQICDVMNMSSVGGVNTGNCSMAPVYVNITSNDIGSGTGSGSSSSLPIITALTDSGSFQNTQTGSVDLFANDSYSGSTPTQSTVTVSLVGNTLSGATVSPEGILTVPPNSLSGTYYAVYQICDKIHANNCSSAVVTLHITGSGVNPPGGNGSTNTGSTNTGSTSTGSTNTGNTNTGTIIPPATTPSSGGGGYSPSPIVPVSVPVQVGTMSGVNMLGGSVVGTLVGGNVFGGSGLLLYSAPTLAGSSSVGSGSGGLSGSGGSIGSQGTSAPTLPTILFPTFVPSCTSAVKNLDDPRLSVYFDEIGVVDKTNIDRRLTRVEFLKLVLNAAKVDLSKAPRETSFQDVRNNTWYAPYVSYAKTASIISGDTTGNFRPNDMITRAEASKIFVQVLGVKPIIGKTSFADIPKSSTLGHYVEAAYESCLVHGRNTLNGEPREGEERKFEPHDTISLGETGKVLYNSVGR